MTPVYMYVINLTLASSLGLKDAYPKKIQKNSFHRVNKLISNKQVALAISVLACATFAYYFLKKKPMENASKDII